MSQTYSKVAALTKLNYSLRNSTRDLLESYCRSTGRGASDVTRQLICEYLSGSRDFINKPGEQTESYRTTLLLTDSIFESFDAAAKFSGITRGFLIDNLIVAYVLEEVKSDCRS